MTGHFPPGVEDWDLPGGRPGDVAWESLFSAITDSGLTPAAARERWEEGSGTCDLTGLLSALERCVSFVPHDDPTRMGTEYLLEKFGRVRSCECDGCGEKFWVGELTRAMTIGTEGDFCPKCLSDRGE